MCARKKKYSSERPFSVMLAEELLRAELRKLYGDGIKILQCVISGSPPAHKKNRNDSTITALEESNVYAFERVWERELQLDGRVGPFGRLYPENPLEDRRRVGRNFIASCRLFSVETNVIIWRPHYLLFSLYEEHGQPMTITEKRFYEDGRLLNEPHFKNAENSCQEMCDTVPALHQLAYADSVN